MICHKANLGQNLEGSIKTGRELLVRPVDSFGHSRCIGINKIYILSSYCRSKVIAV